MRHKRTTKLLVSVRSAEEAEAALAGGADLIDVKEPSRGSLGAASPDVIGEVAACVGERVPVSAALGEWRDPSSFSWGALNRLNLAFVKWGLAGCVSPSFAADLMAWRQLIPHSTELVITAYADWRRAESMPPEALARFAVQFSFRTLLIDTWQKDGSTLLDWMPEEHVRHLTEYVHEAGVRIALAGSLGIKELDQLCEIEPDWFAVRGAVCSGGRAGQVECRLVRELAIRLKKKGARSAMERRGN